MFQAPVSTIQILAFYPNSLTFSFNKLIGPFYYSSWFMMLNDSARFEVYKLILATNSLFPLMNSLDLSILLRFMLQTLLNELHHQNLSYNHFPGILEVSFMNSFHIFLFISLFIYIYIYVYIYIYIYVFYVFIYIYMLLSVL